MTNIIVQLISHGDLMEIELFSDFGIEPESRPFMNQVFSLTEESDTFVSGVRTVCKMIGRAFREDCQISIKEKVKK